MQILIPGLWLDASSWDPVLPALPDPRPLTLPSGPAITLRDWIDFVVAEIDSLEERVALVGHSAGAAVAYAAADRRPERVARLIYVDAFPPAAGDAVNLDLPVVAGEIPLPDWSVFEEPDLIDLDDSLRAVFRARAIAAPARVARDPIELSDDERRFEIPATVVCCEFSSAELREWMAGGYVPELDRTRDVTYIDLPTGHWPQLTRPDDLGRALRDALADV